MVQSDLSYLRHVIPAVLVILALGGIAAAAELGPPADASMIEAVKPAAPADGQPSDLLSKLRFYGEFGPLYLHRQGNRSSTLINNTMDLPSLDLGWKAGLEARAGVNLGKFSAGFRWFNAGHVLDGWSEGTRSTKTFAITDPSFTAVQQFNFRGGLSSDFTNIEGYLGWQIHPYVAVLAGVRNVVLDDDLGMKATVVRDQESTATGIHTFTTTRISIGSRSRNRLWGGQLGVDSRVPIWTPDLLVGGTVKTALLHNSAKNKLSLVQQIGSSIGSGDRNGQNSWAIELVMELRYNIFSWATLVARYQGLWLQRVAQGTDQVNKQFDLVPTNGALSPVAGAGAVNTRSLWFHGPRAAIVIRLPE